MMQKASESATCGLCNENTMITRRRLRRRTTRQQYHIVFLTVAALYFLLCTSAFTFLPFHTFQHYSITENTFKQSFSSVRQQHTAFTEPTLHAKTQHLVEELWFPRASSDYRDDIYNDSAQQVEDIEGKAIKLAATLIDRKISQQQQISCNDAPSYRLAQGRFIDLTFTKPNGEDALERLFLDKPAIEEIDENVIQGAIMALQSLCILGTRVGVKGPPEQLRLHVAHLESSVESGAKQQCTVNGNSNINTDNTNGNNYNQVGVTGDSDDLKIRLRDLHTWDRDSVRRLKFRLEKAAGIQLLAALKRKRTMQGAFDVLVELGAWDKHEEVALLRSGFPLRFTESEIQAAAQAKTNQHDPDTILNLRKDLRSMKVYTIDGPSASEIDDGLSVEKITNDDGTERLVYWIHIADADRWAPRNSELFEAARRRITSIYLPNRSLSMFPTEVSTDVMSLRAQLDAHALSLKLELNNDGSIDTLSVEVYPSIIRVDYRLTYDDVDEMLEEGVGYQEEWQIGALLAAAQKRRQYRKNNGSMESAVPNLIPQASVSVYPDNNLPDGIGINVNLQMSHNAGKNQSALSESEVSLEIDPVSSANLLVTEAMIMAGEALGYWKRHLEYDDERDTNSTNIFKNNLRLPFRTQSQPDWKSRSRERHHMMSLIEYNVGNGLCHAWYVRRFLQSVRVTELQLPHSGLGLQSYVQWTSPIRRFSDLQVHAAVKRCIRRRHVVSLLRRGESIPDKITALDLGLDDSLQNFVDAIMLQDNSSEIKVDGDIDYMEGIGLFGVARKIQRQSHLYWIYEYIRRQFVSNPAKVYTGIVLGCVDPTKNQHAIYVYDLGLEHKISTPGSLEAGERLLLRVDSVSPMHALLSFVQVN